MGASLEDLRQRVERLEREVARLRGTTPQPVERQMSETAVAPIERAYGRAPDVIAHAEPASAEDEVFGKWFPRLGALALVLGAGFGFKYAVDRGWVGPGLRVLAGILAAMGLLALGEWSRRREWNGFAQAVSGAGLALLYLTLWASLHLYGFLSEAETFVFLLEVSTLAAALALRHDAQPLAVVALLGAFMNPFVTGTDADMPVGLYLYALAIDGAVLGLSLVRDWRVLEKLAFVASWVVFAAGNGTRATSLTAATVAFVIFGALPYIRAFIRRSEAGISDFGLVVTNGLIYYAAVLLRLTGDLEQVRSPFTLALAAAYAGAAFALLDRRDVGILRLLTSGMALFFVVVWAPVALEPRFVALAWSLQAALLVGAAAFTRSTGPRAAGWLVLTLAVLYQFNTGSMDPAAAVDANFGRFVLAVAIAVLYLSAYFEARVPLDTEIDAGVVVVAAANVLSVAWLSFELYAGLSSEASIPPDPADLHFGLSALWGLYAGTLLGIGFVVRSRTARLLAMTLFGVTIAKMALHDLWLLDTLQRLVGFVGIGLLLLVASLGYHRFKDLVTGNALEP